MKGHVTFKTVVNRAKKSSLPSQKYISNISEQKIDSFNCNNITVILLLF